jgi:hypothetical protein
MSQSDRLNIESRLCMYGEQHNRTCGSPSKAMWQVHYGEPGSMVLTFTLKMVAKC